ncbi:retrovirus-related pol polyprotein from transposon TNT 1-94 [Tanacetum coccineum]|uniref:Retrovirus-related pol polyprotein from transposon TNT 1-94 n=1 Tax=Tanacetum coccineum TaxID=301880 RepID=A0ABQ5D1F4_9ASTR
MHESKSFNKHHVNKTLYHALMESLIADENIIDQGVDDLIKHKKRPHDDADREQDPPVGLKKRKMSKDAEPPKKPKSSGSSKDTTRSQPKLTGKSIQSEETVFEAADTKMPLNKGNDMGDVDEQPDVKVDPKQDCTPIDFSAFAMNRLKISKLTKVDLVGQNNPKGNHCPYDLSKPLPLKETRGRLTVPVDFFFNNDLEYLKGGSTDKKYTASTTKTKAAKYDVEGIEDMVPKLWSLIKVAYDKHAALGISHWGPKRQRFYGYVINKVSRHDVYSTMRILIVTSVTVDEWYEYGHLKEIVSRVKDLQLGVESYEKKLNILKLQTRDVNLSRRALYTTLSEPQGVIYKEKLKRKRLVFVPMIPLEPEGSTQTKTELTLEQTQQGVSDEVLITCILQDVNENLFIPASMVYDHEMVPKSKDWVERHNPDSKLPNFNTGRILVPESQAVNKELLQALRHDDCRNYPECEICVSYDHFTPRHNRVILVRGGALVESSQSSESSIGVRCNTCGSTVHSTTDHNDFDHFKIAPKRNAIYVLDMSSLTPNEACFFAKALESVNWLWHKRLSHLNFKNINKLTKQNKVLGLPSLLYSKDKPCSACEKGKHKRASFKTKQNFLIRKCLHLLYMDLFGHIRPMSVNNEKYTLVIVDEYSRYTCVYFLRKKSQAAKMIMSFSRMVENQNDIKVKQIRTDNEVEFRNSELESFCVEKGISQNFSSLYTLKQNGVAERKNKTLIEAARTMLNGLDHLGKFDTKADDGYLLGYSFNSKAFRAFNTRRQQIEETYHVTFDESIKAIRFINTLLDEIRINDSSRYPPGEFLHEDDPSRQYQSNFEILYHVIPQGHSLTELIQDKHVPEDEQIINQPTKESSENNIENSIPTTEPLVRKDRWSNDPHVELVNIIGDPSEGMLTRSMAAKLTASSASKCLFTDFLSEIEPKKEEGIDYDETFAPMARMEAIRFFLAFATYMNFIVFQMDVKSAFLNGKLKEKVYVKQPPSFKSSEFPDYVCKLDRSLYGLKQAPMAWRGSPSSSDNKGISISQEHYTRNLLKKYEISDSSLVKTHMVSPTNLGPNLAGKPSSPKESQLIVVKRIFAYLKDTPSHSLWYPKYSGFNLKGYSDSDYDSCNMDRKITSGACQILSGKLVYWSATKQESVAMSSAKAEYVATAGCCANIL